MRPGTWKSFLIAFLFCLSFGAAIAKSFSNGKRSDTLKAFLGPIPKTIDPTTVTSFTEYVIIQHLTRGLVKLDSNGELTGDLAESWKINRGAEKFVFQLKKNQFFSNGDLIDAQSVAGSIQRQIKKGKTIHYNFLDIKSVKAVGSLTIELELHKADFQFITKLAYPEFGVLHESDYKKQVDLTCEWKITSGATVLEDFNSKGIKLVQKYQDKTRIIEIVPALQNVDGSISKDIDFFVGVPPLSESQHLSLSESFSSYSPRLAFTYFFSFGSKSSLGKNKAQRISVVKLLKKFRSTLVLKSPFHSLARQLYLEDGPGRTTQDKLQIIHEQHGEYQPLDSTSLNLKVLVQKNMPYTEQLVTFLKDSGLKFSLFTYANFDEFEKLNDEHSFDLIQSNNDFSSIDLTTNIMVTLNPSRPLINTFGNLEIEALSGAFNSDLPDVKRISSIQRIEEILLEDAFVLPVFHLNMYFYVRKSIDSHSLSRRFPEVAVWKLK